MVSPRSKSLALHEVCSRSINSDAGEDGEGVEFSTETSNPLPCRPSENQEVSPTGRKQTGDGAPPAAAAAQSHKEAEKRQNGEVDAEQVETDKLFLHLRDNMETIREFCKDMVQQVPTPDQCVIEGNVSVAACSLCSADKQPANPKDTNASFSV